MKKLAIIMTIIILIGGSLWWIYNYTNFFQTAKIVPPLPVFTDCQSIQAEIEKYDWDTELATAVMKAESSCDTEARGDEDITYYDCAPEYANDATACAENQRLYGYSVGVFQVRILPGREDCDTYDVAKNVECAHEIYVEDGGTFAPWSGWTTGKYKHYLWRTVEEL